MTSLKIVKNYESEEEVAYKFYSLLLELNDLRVSVKDRKVLAHTCVHENISSTKSKEKCMEKLGISSSSLYNSVSSLQKKKLLIKREDDKIVVNPSLNIKFDEGLKIDLNIVVGFVDK